MSSKLGRTLCLALSWACLTCASASASVHTWTGPAGGLWSNPANWTGGVPTSGEPSGGTIVAFGSNSSSVMDIAGLTVDQVHFTGNTNTIAGSGGKVLSVAGTAQTYNILNDGSANQLLSSLTIEPVGGVNLFVRSDGSQLTWAGPIVGSSAGIRFLGAGANGTTLTGANTFTRPIVVASGTLRLNSNALDAAVSGTGLTIGTGSGTGATVVLDQVREIADATDVTVNSDGTLNANGLDEGFHALTVSNGAITTGAGSLTLGGALTMTGGAISGSGALALGADAALTSSAAQTATIGNPVTLNGARTLTIADGAQATDATLSGVLSNGTGTGALTKDGPGRLLLSTATNSTYSGGTLVRDGDLLLNGNAAAVVPSTGTLTIGDGAGAASSARVTLGQGNEIGTAAPVAVAGDGLLDLAGFGETVAALTATGGSVASTAGTFFVTGGLTLTDATASLGTAGALNVTGPTTLTGGAITGSGTATLTPNGGVQATSSAAGSSAISAAVALGGTRSFTVAPGSAPELTLSGPTSGGSGAIDKQGAGSLRLTGAAGHALTAIGGGTLIADGTVSGPISVNGGGRLSGSGTVGAVTVAGALKPSAPQLTTGALSFGATGRLEGDVASAAPPQVVANGTVTIDPAATVALSPAPGLTLARDTSLTLIVNDGADPISGTFAGVPFALGALPLTPNYSGGTGNDLTVAVGNGAPAPGAATASPATAPAGQPVAFSVVPADPNGDALTTTWDFGDGSAPATGALSAHVYDKGGTFTAKATVSDGALSATATVAVTITTAAPPGGITKGPPPPACDDRSAPVTRLDKPSITRKGLTVTARAADVGCSRTVARVDVAVARRVGKRCAWIGGPSKPSSCARIPSKALKRATFKKVYSYKLKRALKPGTYVVAAIARDAAGNVEAVLAKRHRIVTLKPPRRS